MRYVKLTFPKPEPEPLVVQVYDSDSDAAGDPHDDELPLIAEAALAAMSDEQREEVLVKHGRLAHVSTHTLDGLGKENARLRAEVELMRPVVEAAERARDRRDERLENYAGMSPDRVCHLGTGSYATQHDLNLWRAVDEYRSRK